MVIFVLDYFFDERNNRTSFKLMLICTGRHFKPFDRVFGFSVLQESEVHSYIHSFKMF